MDLVVTVPKGFWLKWIAEGDAAGDPETGEEWGFSCGRAKPGIEPGERLYVVAWGRLRGYAPVTRLAQAGVRFNLYGVWKPWIICRQGGAVPVTLPLERGEIDGFRGARKRWWDWGAEVAFPDWRSAGIPQRELVRMRRGIEASP